MKSTKSGGSARALDVAKAPGHGEGLAGPPWRAAASRETTVSRSSAPAATAASRAALAVPSVLSSSDEHDVEPAGIVLPKQRAKASPTMSRFVARRTLSPSRMAMRPPLPACGGHRRARRRARRSTSENEVEPDRRGWRRQQARRSLEITLCRPDGLSLKPPDSFQPRHAAAFKRGAFSRPLPPA